MGAGFPSVVDSGVECFDEGALICRRHDGFETADRIEGRSRGLVVSFNIGLDRFWSVALRMTFFSLTAALLKLLSA